MKSKYQKALDVMYDNYVYGAKQKEDSYFILQELINETSCPVDFDEAMKFHRIEIQEHLGAIANLQEKFTCSELGSMHYHIDRKNIERYLNVECEDAIEEVMEFIESYLDNED